MSEYSIVKWLDVVGFVSLAWSYVLIFKSRSGHDGNCAGWRALAWALMLPSWIVDRNGWWDVALVIGVALAFISVDGYHWWRRIGSARVRRARDWFGFGMDTKGDV